MRIHRFALFVGWALTTALAVAGFAAFRPSSGPAPASAPAASSTTVDVGTLGANAGAVAALTFATSEPPSTTSSTTNLDAVVQADIARVTAEARATTTTTTKPPPPPPTTTPPYSRSSYLSEIEVRKLVEKYFKPEDVNKAIRVAWCESSFNPNAVNPISGAMGLFQHLPQYWAKRSAAAGITGADPFDPDANVRVAAWLLYDFGGWKHWVCQP